MPEGDTLFRTAAGLRPYLVGRDVTAARAQGPGAVPQVQRIVGQAHRRGRVAGQEPADPVRRRPRAPDPPADERLVASLPAGRALAPAARPGPARAGGRRARSRSASMRRSSSCSRRARRRSIRRCRGSGRTCSRPTSMPPRRIAGCARPSAPSSRSASRSSTSGRWPASATSTRTRSCGSSGSRRSRASRRSTTRPSSGWSRPRGGCCAPTSTRGAARSGSRRPATAARRAAVRLRPRGSAVPPLRHARSRVARQGTDLPRSTYWCPTCQGGTRRMTEIDVRCAADPDRLALRRVHRRRARNERHEVTVAAEDATRPRGRRGRVRRRAAGLRDDRLPARARAQGVDPARVRSHGRRPLLPRVRVRDPEPPRALRSGPSSLGGRAVSDGPAGDLDGARALRGHEHDRGQPDFGRPPDPERPEGQIDVVEGHRPHDLAGSRAWTGSTDDDDGELLARSERDGPRRRGIGWVRREVRDRTVRWLDDPAQAVDRGDMGIPDCVVDGPSRPRIVSGKRPGLRIFVREREGLAGRQAGR